MINNPSISRVEPVLRWDGMGYDITDRGLGVNRITVGANMVFKTTLHCKHYTTAPKKSSNCFLLMG